MRTLALILLGALTGCGSTRPCKGGTVFVTVTLDGAARAATNVEVDIQTDAGDHRSGIFAVRSVGAGSVEIDFPAGYPEGQTVTVRVNALQGAGTIATGRATFTAAPGCSAVAVGIGDDDGGGGCDPTGVEDRCSADRKSVLVCRADGSGFDTQQCHSTCGDTGAPAHCLELQPSGSADLTDYSGTANVTLSADTVFDTDSGAITGGFTRPAGAGAMAGVGFRSISQPGSTVRIGVFGFAGLTVAQGATITLAGKSPLAIVSSADVLIAGTLNLQGDCNLPPTGGGGTGGRSDVNNGDGLGTRGGRSGGGAANAASGGGGGGGGDNGGRGGNSGATAGGAGGVAYGDLTTEPLLLVGGSGGGAGGAGMAPTTGGFGGNGGGAVQIAVDGALKVSGMLHAGGCGGRAGAAQAGGGGGGSGGAILLEAITIDLAATATLATNGGGGGGGDAGGAGGNGGPNANFATAGTAANAGTAGGSGGATGRLTGANGADGAAKNCGGGGGASGRIALKTAAGTITDEGSTLSPTANDRTAAMQPVLTVGRAAFE